MASKIGKIIKQILLRKIILHKSDFYDIIVYMIIAFIFLYYHNRYIDNARLFYVNYPNQYMWSELSISYAGGFVRRGLVGSILFYLTTHGINIQLIVPVFIYCITVLLVAYCIKEIYNNFDCKIALFIIMSPGCLFFRFYDYGVFARMDTIIICIFLIIMYIVYRFEIKYIYIYIYIIVLLGMLIHEMLLFYLPAPFFLLYKKWKIENLNIKLFYIYCLLIVISATIFILFFNGSVQHCTAIEAQWKSILPVYEMGQNSGLSWIGKGIKDGLPILYFPNPSIWMVNVFLGYLLTFLPLFFCIWKYKLIYIFLNINTSIFERIFLIFSIVSPVFLVILTLDSGRFISMHSVELIFFIIYLSKFDNFEIKYKCNNFLFYIIPLLLIYSLSWRMIHYSCTGSILQWTDMTGGFIFLL